MHMFQLKLIQSPQPDISSFKKLLMVSDFFQQKFAKTSYVSPKSLLTKNRKDIEYRIDFLKDVLENQIAQDQTLYYQFIADDDKNVIMNAKKISDDFLELCSSVKKNGMREAISIGYYSTKNIKTRYILNHKKNWIEIENENGFQIINGAHRLAVALFLELEKIPVKIYRSLSFEIPNYTEYLKIKEPEYLEKLEK